MHARICAGAILAMALASSASAQGTNAAAQQPAPPKPPAVITGAVLQGLDKLVARVHEVEAPLNKEAKLGTLQILVRQCVVSPPEAPPEASAFLEISEQRPGEEPRKVFAGWMFASSPALSALEHPVYDVWVVGCKTSDSAAPAKSR